MKTKNKKISAADFDAKFDRGEDVYEHLDLRVPMMRVNVAFPA